MNKEIIGNILGILAIIFGLIAAVLQFGFHEYLGALTFLWFALACASFRSIV